ncbi:MAG: hypothetical protein V9H25_00815 [Candidatus Competibacter sp.]
MLTVCLDETTERRLAEACRQPGADRRPPRFQRLPHPERTAFERVWLADGG